MNKDQCTLMSFDWAIKNILRQKPNFVILEGFLSELLEQDIHINAILESESNKEDPLDKINQVDILCESSAKELILVELQYNSEFDYFHRMLYGVSKIISNYMAKGYQYKEVRKVYSINIVYFELGQGDDYIYYGTTSFEGIHKHDTLRLSNAQKKLFNYSDVNQVFPEYYIIQINKFNDIANSSLDEWIYYLKNSELPKNYSAKGLKEAQEILNYMNMDDQAKIDYNAHQKALAISSSVIETAILEGEIKGEIRGEAKGKAEERKKAELEKETIVCNAYKKVKDIVFVTEITELTNEQVLNILKKHGLM